VEQARTTPGVISISPSTISPLSGDFSISSIRAPGSRWTNDQEIWTDRVGPDYFKTLGIPLVAGRVFSEQDGLANRAMILNQKAAAHLWPGEDPIGKQVVLVRQTYEVIGIVKDVKTESLRKDAPAAAYLPFPLDERSRVTLHVRVAGPTAPVISALIRELRALDPNVPALNVATMAGQLDRTIALD